MPDCENFRFGELCHGCLFSAGTLLGMIGMHSDQTPAFRRILHVLSASAGDGMKGIAARWVVAGMAQINLWRRQVPFHQKERSPVRQFGLPGIRVSEAAIPVGIARTSPWPALRFREHFYLGPKSCDCYWCHDNILNAECSVVKQSGHDGNGVLA